MKLTKEMKGLVRNFSENSVKFLMHNSANVQEGLRMIAPEQARLIDFAKLTVMQNTFIAPDFRHLETDILLRAPLLGKRKGKQTLPIWIYALIEHHSQPDDLAVYRALRYLMQVFDLQYRQKKSKQGQSRNLRFDPVLPIVFYTGTQKWERLTPLCELLEQGQLFADLTPQVSPLFFDLSTTEPGKLHQEAGLFGWVLHLLQQRHGDAGDFRALLQQVVGQVQQLPESQQGRWRDLLWFLHALVYHEREEKEHEPLAEFICQTVSSRTREVEVRSMGRTIAEKLRAEGEAKGMKKGKLEGKQEGKQEALLRQLRKRFDSLPAEIEAQVKATKDETQLDTWLDEIVTAKSLAKMSFSSKS
jgi:hypothetical protein